MSNGAKLQRWIDLVTALLARKLPATFEEIARDVPGYFRAVERPGHEPTKKDRDSVKRTFERDKKELRALGVPIETLGEDGDAETRYRLSGSEFYLPYLALASARGRQAPAGRDRHGYRAQAALVFEPDELRAVSEAAHLARQLGDPALAADAESAIRKLAFDLPVDAAGDPTLVLEPRDRADREVLETLGDALARRKLVSFEYHTIGSDSVASRTVEPYGLFFLGGHWYLAARDPQRGAVRNFRVSRIRAPEVNAKREGTPDYEVPAEFRLREHARSRQAWELGDGDEIEAVVEFGGASGAATAARALGHPVEGHETRRRFSVRRQDAFVRWLLSFAGELRPVSPEGLVAEYRRQVAATREVYGGGR